MLKQLKARLIAIAAEATAIADAGDAAGGGFTDEQTASFDALMAEKETVSANIKRLEQLADMNASAGRVTAPIAVDQSAEIGEGVVSVVERKTLDKMEGFADAAEYGLVVRGSGLPGAAIDDRLHFGSAPSDPHREQSSADGYMVPPAMREEIWKIALDASRILGRVGTEQTNSNEVKLRADESTAWGATGIQAHWAGENTQGTVSRLATNARNVPLHKLFVLVEGTDELLSDAPRLAGRLTDGAARAIAWKSDQAIVDGDGVAKPLGWTKSDAYISVAKKSGQAADTVVSQNISDMYARLLHEDMQGAFWQVHSTVLPQLTEMSIGQRPVWVAPSGLMAAPGGTLMGLPVDISQHCETLGDKGDIQLIAPRGYYAATKAGGVKFASSIHLYFDYDVEAFRWTFRLGGQPFLTAPVAQAKGSATLSHFVTLDARA